MSTLTAAYSVQSQHRDGTEGVDTLTHHTRERFTEEEVAALLGSVSEVAHPHGRTQDVASGVVLHDGGLNHGWPSYRAVAAAPTDGDVAVGISWRFTAPYRSTVFPEVDNLWAHPVGTPLELPEPRPECSPITVGETYLWVTPSMRTPVTDGRLPRAARLDEWLAPKLYTEGGMELLSPAEKAFLEQVLRALVDQDRTFLEGLGAYDNDGDPYLWVRNYGHLGEVHLVLPPGGVDDWPVDVMQVDTSPGTSSLVVTMWTAEEGASDLSLELNLTTDPSTGTVTGEFCGLHVM